MQQIVDIQALNQADAPRSNWNLGARLAMFQLLTFNEKIKEACIALVTRIQAPKFCCTNVELEPSRIFP